MPEAFEPDDFLTPLPLLSEDGVTGMPLRKLRSINKALEGASALQDDRCRVALRARSLLRMTPKDVEAATNVDSNAVVATEREGRRPERSSHAGIIQLWERAAAATTDDPVLRYELQGLTAKMLKLLAGEDEGTPIGEYRKWALLVGPETFETQGGLTYGALWQRRAQGTLGSMHEAVAIARKTGLIAADDAGSPALHPRMHGMRTALEREALTHGRPLPVARLLIALEASGVPSDVAHLSACGIPQRVAADLIAYNVPAWADVQPLVERARPHMVPHEFTALKAQWEAAEAAEEARPSFHGTMAASLRAQGIGNTEVANLLDIRKRKPGVKKPAHLVRHVLSGDSYSEYVPHGVLAHLARSREEIAELLRLSAERDALLRRRKSGLLPDPMLAAKALWQVPGKNVEQVTANGHERTVEMLQKWLKYRKPPTVADIALLAERHGGYLPLEARMTIKVTCAQLKRYAAKEQLPWLGDLRSIVKDADAEVTEYLVEDWRLSQGDALKAEGVSPLPRALRALLAEFHPSFRDFCLKTSGDSWHTMRRRLLELEAGKELPWEEVAQFLTRMGIDPASDRAVFVRCLWDAKGDRSAAYAAWLPRMGRQNIDVDPCVEFLPGSASDECPRVHQFDEDFNTIEALLKAKLDPPEPAVARARPAREATTEPAAVAETVPAPLPVASAPRPQAIARREIAAELALLEEPEPAPHEPVADAPLARNGHHSPVALLKPADVPPGSDAAVLSAVCAAVREGAVLEPAQRAAVAAVDPRVWVKLAYKQRLEEDVARRVWRDATRQGFLADGARPIGAETRTLLAEHPGVEAAWKKKLPAGFADWNKDDFQTFLDDLKMGEVMPWRDTEQLWIEFDPSVDQHLYIVDAWLRSSSMLPARVVTSMMTGLWDMLDESQLYRGVYYTYRSNLVLDVERHVARIQAAPTIAERPPFAPYVLSRLEHYRAKVTPGGSGE